MVEGMSSAMDATAVPNAMAMHTGAMGFSFRGGPILFEVGVPESTDRYLSAVVATICLGMLSIWLRAVREPVLRRATSVLDANMVRALFIMVTTFFDYVLMLIAMMLFDIGLFMAIIAGVGLGALCFGHWGAPVADGRPPKLSSAPSNHVPSTWLSTWRDDSGAFHQLKTELEELQAELASCTAPRPSTTPPRHSRSPIHRRTCCQHRCHLLHSH